MCTVCILPIFIDNNRSTLKGTSHSLSMLHIINSSSTVSVVMSTEDIDLRDFLRLPTNIQSHYITDTLYVLNTVYNSTRDTPSKHVSSIISLHSVRRVMLISFAFCFKIN
jgi:hypothetical protein